MQSSPGRHEMEPTPRISRYVMPAINHSNRHRRASLDWAHADSQRFVGAMVGGIGKAIEEHEAERMQRGGKGTAWG